MVLKYENEVNGRELSYYGLLDDFVRKDSVMQAALGFSTVYTTYNIFKDGFEFKPFKPKRLKESYVPSHYLELANRIKRDGRPKEDVFEFILSMQSGIPAERIYYQLYGIEDKGIASFSPVTSSQDGSSGFSPDTSLQENSSVIEANNKSVIEANSKSIEDTGSEVKMYDFSKLLEN